MFNYMDWSDTVNKISIVSVFNNLINLDFLIDTLKSQTSIIEYIYIYIIRSYKVNYKLLNI